MNVESDAYVVKYNLDGNYLMSGHADRTVRLWNANKGVPIKVYEGVQNREVFDIAM
jgi:WD40 repeat protein